MAEQASPLSGERRISDAKRALVERYLRTKGNSAAASQTTILKRAGGAPAPLSLSQEGIWRRAHSIPGIPLYNETITIHRRGPLDVAAFERAFNEVLRRHEAWRTNFDVLNGEIVQVIQRSLDVSLPVVDLRNLPEHDREAEALRLAAVDARQPFHLADGPLFRPRLVRLAEKEYRLFLAVHQIILDGVSVYHVLLPELAALYDAFSHGHPSPLPELPIQVADFAVWQRAWLQGETREAQIAYWRTQLGGHLPVLAWPNDKRRPPRQTFRGAIYPFVLSRDVGEAARALSKREGVTLFVTALATYAALLYAYTGQDDLIIGTPSPAGRKRTEVQNSLGYFLNPVALRLDLSDNPSFEELIRQAWEVTSGALSNDDVPFEAVVEEVNAAQDPSRNPLFTLAISQEPPMPAIDPAWNLTPMDVTSGGARWDLYLVLDDRRGVILGRAQYNPDLFELSAITEIVADFQRLLETVAAAPGQRVDALRHAQQLRGRR